MTCSPTASSSRSLDPVLLFITLGEFPGLGSDSLFEGQDLDTSTDFRQVLAEALVRRMGFGVGQLETVFPAMGGYQPLGLFET